MNGDDVLSFVKEWGTVLAVTGAVITFLWSVVQFMLNRGRESKNRDYQVYHQLIKEIVQPDPGGETYVARQMAAVHELRNFPRYFQITYRVANHLKVSWADKLTTKPDLAYEIDELISITAPEVRRSPVLVNEVMRYLLWFS